MSDGELLASYAAHGSRPALAQLVERHAPMVYSTCLRVTGSQQLAEDATQAVFLMLTRGARRLAGQRVLCGWLHSAAYQASCRAREREENEEVYIETRELAAVD